MQQNKIWPVLRDVVIVTVLSCLGGFIVGFASTDHSSRLYFYSLSISNSLFLILGFTVSGCLAVGNRWRHLAFVGAIVWLVSIFNVIFFGFPIVMWMASVVAVAIFALVGGGISLLFKPKTRAETSFNAGDDKFYDAVARELQEKSMVASLWTRAIAETGDEGSTAKSLYIRLRVQELIRQEQEDHEKSRAEVRRKVVEQRRATEAAKPPLKWYEQLANVLLGCFCGCVTILFTILIIVCLSEEDRASSGMSLPETLMVIFFIGGIAFSFGFITYKCFRAVLR